MGKDRNEYVKEVEEKIAIIQKKTSAAVSAEAGLGILKKSIIPQLEGSKKYKSLLWREQRLLFADTITPELQSQMNLATDKTELERLRREHLTMQTEYLSDWIRYIFGINQQIPDVMRICVKQRVQT